MATKKCINCGNEIQDDYAVCPYCGVEQPKASSSVGPQVSSILDRHIENHDKRDMSMHDHRDQSVHNTSNVTTNNTTKNEIHYHGGAEPEMTQEELDEAYENERELLEMRLKNAKDESVFAIVKTEINAEWKTNRISRVEKARREKLLWKYQEEFKRKQAAGSSSVRQTSSQNYLSSETARKIHQNVQPTPIEPVAVPENGKNTKQGGRVLKGCITFAIVVALLFWGLKSCIGCGGSKDESEEVDTTEVVDGSSEEKPNEETVSKSRKRSSNAENSATSSKSSQENTPTETEKTPEPKAEPQSSVAESAPAAPLSASELVAEGTKAIRKMNYDKAATYLKQAADMGNIDACYQLGLLNVNNNYDRANRQTAINYFTKAANAGRANAMYELGNIYSGRDNAQANYWYEKAAACGHEKAASKIR